MRQVDQSIWAMNPGGCEISARACPLYLTCSYSGPSAFSTSFQTSEENRRLFSHSGMSLRSTFMNSKLALPEQFSSKAPAFKDKRVVFS